MSASVDPHKSQSRKLWKFHGGVHPPFHKDDSNQLPIKVAEIPAQLIVPLQQHIGNPAEAIVKVGDYVHKGQIIAESNGNISATVHASSSGKVIAIEERAIPHPSGLNGICIVINTDSKDDWGEHKLNPIADYQNAEVDILLKRIQQSGIVGLGGAVFPTAVKIEGSRKHAIKTLIVNGAECEPYITCDDRLMRERSVEIIKGINILQYMLKPEKCLIAIEDNKPEAILAMQQAVINDPSANLDIEVVTIPTIYPSGGEKQLIEILTGKEVAAGSLPIEMGLLSLNTGTVYSIYRAIIKGEPLLSRIVTVTGNGVQHPQNFEVLLGTPFSHLAVQAGGYSKMAEHLIMGGPMMGFALPNDEVPVIKATNCALFISTTSLNESNSAFSNQPTLPCIRCGKCMEVCPVKLLPQQMYWHIRAKDFEKTQQHKLKDCIECGACSYVCPSHIPLVDYFRFAKTEIREQKIAQVKANLSRERHEFLLFRKEREKREREEKRATHKAALQKKKANSKTDGGSASPTPKADAIKAAMERAQAKKQERQAADKVASESSKEEIK
jgi:electron transport complex protein RnfC